MSLHRLCAHLQSLMLLRESAAPASQTRVPFSEPSNHAEPAPLSVYLRGVEALYLALLHEQIVQLREKPPFFRWASGRLSPIYLDFRRCLASPPLRRNLTDALLSSIEPIQKSFKAVAGVATGGISWAAWLAERLEIPMGYVRAIPKDHGTGQAVEALSPHHSPVLLIEDVLSTGKSVSTAAQNLQQENFTLAAIAVLWDYGLADRNPPPHPLHSVLCFPHALQVWRPYLSEEQHHLLKTWHETGHIPG